MVQFLKCPRCNGLYQVIRAEAGPETRDDELACRVCGAPLAPRDGEFVLKYFLLREAVVDRCGKSIAARAPWPPDPRATRPGASPPTSPSCRSCCAGGRRKARRDEIAAAHFTTVRAMSA